MTPTAALVAVVALTSFGCSSGASSTNSDNGQTSSDVAATPTGDAPATPTEEVVVAIFSDSSPIDPIAAVGNVDRMVLAAVFDPLVELSEEGELIPALATDWQSDDAQTWTVELREDVTFSDGTPFDSDAVIANFERITDPERNPRSGDVPAIASMATIDDHTVEFVLEEPYAPFPALLNDGASHMVSPAVLAETNDVATNPVGTGPFVLEERSADAITVVRNPDYWNSELPRSDRVLFRIIPDTQAQLAALQAGDVDLVFATDSTTNAQAAGVSGVEVVEKPGIGIMQVFLNNGRPPFDDVRARRALAMATDRNAYVQFSNADGEGEVVDGPWPGGMGLTGAATAEEPIAYDPDAARQLVDEIGGLSFTLTSYTFGTYPEQSQLLQDMWAQAGIEAEIDLQELTTVLSEMGTQPYDALLTAWSGRPDPDLNVTRWLHSASTGSPAAVNDSELDELLDSARETPNADERRDLYQQVVDHIADQVHALYLEGLPKSVIVRSDLEGVVMPPDGNVRVQYLH